MTVRHGSAAAKLAFLVAATLLVALGGCGRKGPLDLPPTSSGPIPTANAAATDANTAPAPARSPLDTSGLFGPPPETSTPPARSAKNKPFILDPILN